MLVLTTAIFGQKVYFQRNCSSHRSGILHAGPQDSFGEKELYEMGVLSNYFFKKNPTIFFNSRPCIKSSSKQTGSQIIWRLMVCDQIWLPFSRKKLRLGYHIKWSDQKIKKSRIPWFASHVWLLSCRLTGAHRKSFFNY